MTPFAIPDRRSPAQSHAQVDGFHSPHGCLRGKAVVASENHSRRAHHAPVEVSRSSGSGGYTPAEHEEIA